MYDSISSGAPETYYLKDEFIVANTRDNRNYDAISAAGGLCNVIACQIMQ